jgi:hypothetical protein
LGFILKIIKSLEENKIVDDDNVIIEYKKFCEKLQSNCNSVCQGTLTCAASICMYRNHLSIYLLQKPMQSLYYLGVENFDDITNYIDWFIDFPDPYLGRPEAKAYEWLKTLRLQRDVITESFRLMYHEEDNDWRSDIPKILKDQ